MGILRRLSDVTRTGLADLRKRTFGDAHKTLVELTDSELEEEILRRRRARARRRSGGQGSPADEAVADPDPRYAPGTPQRKQLLQYYANLELEPGAGLDDVRRAYRELMRKYHPDKHAGDPERHRAATELAQSLTAAYRALSEYLTQRARKR